MPIPIHCEECGKNFEVDDAYQGLIVSCTNCGDLILAGKDTPVSKSLGGERKSNSDLALNENQTSRSNPYSEEDDEDAVAANEQKRLLVKTSDGREFGPITSQTVLRWGAEGRLGPDSKISEVGSEVWLDYPVWKTHHMLMQTESKSRQIPPSRGKQKPFPEEPADVTEDDRISDPSVRDRFGSKRKTRLHGWSTLFLGLLSIALIPTAIGSLFVGFLTLWQGIGSLRSNDRDLTQKHYSRELSLTILGCLLASAAVLMTFLYIALVITGF